MTVEGELDDISGIGQTKAAHVLTPNIPGARPCALGAATRWSLRHLQRPQVARARSCRACATSSATTTRTELRQKQLQILT